MAATGGDELDPDVGMPMARRNDPGPPSEERWPDPATARARRWFLWWASPIVLVGASAMSMKILSEVLGEPVGLDTVALGLGIGVIVYVTVSMVGYLLYAALWLPIAHGLGVHRRPCPSCGLTTDARDARCRYCHQPLATRRRRARNRR